MVVQADDVAGIGLFQLLALGGEEGQRVGDLHVLAQAHVAHLHAFLVLARADAHEGDAVAVLGIHVRLDLEHEAGELLLGRLHAAFVGGARQRLRRPVDDAVEDLVDAEVAQRGAEEHRGHLALEEGVLVEFVAGALHQLQLFDEIVVEIAEVGAGFVGVELFDDLGLDALVAVARDVDDDPVVGQVVDALEVLVAADRPGDRRGLDLQHRLDLVEQLDGVADVAVELVDEADDGRVAQPADFHQGDGPRFDALAAVEHHQRRVHRGQGAVGVFGEVFVAGGVEQVDHVLAVGELHHRGGDGDAALLFHLHPVGRGVAVGLARLHGTGDGDRLAHQQELLGDGGLTGVGVGNDREGTALRDFGGLSGHGCVPAGIRWRGRGTARKNAGL
ncbi:hypothetical protein PA99_2147 [Pseudomonas aeruginosa PA99]|nr:hypothetical protein PA99_2147 [Pseudomonas aeruginosa PA99]